MRPSDSEAGLRLFDRPTRGLHWLSAGLIVVVFGLAFAIDRATSRDSHALILQLHRSVGLTVLALTVGRLAWRGWARHPKPVAMPRIMRLAGRASEWTLYAALLAQPVLGLLQTNARGDRVDFFLLGRLPALIGQDRPLARQLLTAHQTLGFVLLGLIALHAAAALFHHLWRRDDTLVAMLPAAAKSRWTERGRR